MGLVSLQAGKGSVRESEAGGLDRILVGDDDDLGGGVAVDQALEHVDHPRRDLVESLGREGQAVGMVEVGGQLAGDGPVEVLPSDAGPPFAQTPLGEPIIDLRLQFQGRSHDGRGLDGAGQRRGDDGGDGP